MTYPKINSLWKRDLQHNLIEGDYSCPEFASIKYWNVTEKIDGTNIRITFCKPDPLISSGIDPWVSFKGRTEDALLPARLVEYLKNKFTVELLSLVFPDEGIYTLFGEGYGAKIQGCGGNYRADQGFILFDIKAGPWWLQREDVKAIATKLDIPVVPELGSSMIEEEIVALVKSKPLSGSSRFPQVMEGIVARPEPLMLFRNGNPVMWKLKVRDFKL